MGSRTPQLNQEATISKGWAGGSTTAWRKTRARILLRDGYTCQVQLPGVCTEQAEQVHHTVGKGVSESDSDLVASCAACNLKLGDVSETNPPHKVTQW